MRESAKFELARLKKKKKKKKRKRKRKKKKKKKKLFGDYLVRYFRDSYARHWELSWPGKHSKMNSRLS